MKRAMGRTAIERRADWKYNVKLRCLRDSRWTETQRVVATCKCRPFVPCSLQAANCFPACENQGFRRWTSGTLLALGTL